MINNQDSQQPLEEQEETLYTPKINWHFRKQWGKGIHPRRVIKSWYIGKTEEFRINDKGLPEITYFGYDPQNKEHGYFTYTVRYGTNIENHWLRKYRHHNDDPFGYYTTNLGAPGKSSRRGMRQKEQIWNQVQEYLDSYPEFEDDEAA